MAILFHHAEGGMKIRLICVIRAAIIVTLVVFYGEQKMDTSHYNHVTPAGLVLEVAGDIGAAFTPILLPYQSIQSIDPQSDSAPR